MYVVYVCLHTRTFACNTVYSSFSLNLDFPSISAWWNLGILGTGVSHFGSYLLLEWTFRTPWLSNLTAVMVAYKQTLLSKQTLMPGLKSTQPFASKTFSKELSEKWSARKWDRVRVEVSVLRNLGGTSAEKANITPFGLSFIEFYGPPPRKFRKPKQNTPQMVLLSRASSARRALSGIVSRAGQT